MSRGQRRGTAGLFRSAEGAGEAHGYLFATSDGRNWMTGPEEVRFEDRGHTGIFRWADFRLEVDDS